MSAVGDLQPGRQPPQGGRAPQDAQLGGAKAGGQVLLTLQPLSRSQHSPLEDF